MQDLLEWLGVIPVNDPETLYEMIRWILTVAVNVWMLAVVWKLIHTFATLGGGKWLR